MMYSEWLNTNWGNNTTGLFMMDPIQDNWSIYLEHDKQKAIERINKHFKKEPTIIVKLTQEAFLANCQK